MRVKKKNQLKDTRIVVTGGGGFLGTHLVELLKKEQPKEIIVPRSREFDLRRPEVCQQLFAGADTVIHLAANVGGIGYNREHPAELFYDNITMGVTAMHEAWKAGVKKFVALGTICAYPKYTPVPFKESDLWLGYPEETNAPYGLAKKMLLVQAQAYRQQYGFNAVYLLPTNLYGPGDNFNPTSSHVIPALIKKFVDAKAKRAKEVVVWGTGTPTREFLYVEDAAEGIILATKHYNKSEPVNLGSQFEISIAELAHLIGDLVGFKGAITFDVSQPDGQPRRKIDTSRAEEEFGFTARTSFEQGLAKTIQWYQKSLR
jgi:GDP-L-fucose synthase